MTGLSLRGVGLGGGALNTTLARLFPRLMMLGALARWRLCVVVVVVVVVVVHVCVYVRVCVYSHADDF